MYYKQNVLGASKLLSKIVLKRKAMHEWELPSVVSVFTHQVRSGEAECLLNVRSLQILFRNTGDVLNLTTKPPTLR